MSSPCRPPNITGILHLGHAIMDSVEDMMIRYQRMTGRPTLWVPGTDHAGIATQNVVERELAKEGLTRQDLGRDKVHRAGVGVEARLPCADHQPEPAHGHLLRLVA